VAEAAATAEAAERAAREAVAARAAMKQQLRASSLQYQLHLQGTAVAAPVPAGGRQPQLSVTLTLLPDTPSGRSSGSASAPPSVAQVNRVYDSPDAATEGATALAVHAAQLVYEHYIPAIAEGVIDLEGLSVFGQAAQGTQQQQQQDQTAGQDADAAVAQATAEGSNAAAQGVQLSAADNMLWRLLLLCKVEAAGRQAVGQVAPLAASGELQQELKVRVKLQHVHVLGTSAVHDVTSGRSWALPMYRSGVQRHTLLCVWGKPSSLIQKQKHVALPATQQ